MRAMPDRTLVLATLTVDPDGRVRFPVFDGEEDVPCYFALGALELVHARAGYFATNPRNPESVKQLLAAFTSPMVVRFGWQGSVVVVVGVGLV